MRPRFVRFLAMFLALCLPLQAAVALDMSARAAFGHGQGAVFAGVVGNELATAADAHESHCPHEAQGGNAGAVSGDDCPTSCVVCHFACAGFMPAAAAPTAARPAGHVLVPTLRILADQIAPDGPRRPPRAAA